MDEPQDETLEWVRLAIDGTLDLHTFPPGEIRQLIPDYIEACLLEGILDLRIIHGKGKGVLRRLVHAILDRHPNVASYRHEEGTGGGWGATVVRLVPTGKRA